MATNQPTPPKAMKTLRILPRAPTGLMDLPPELRDVIWSHVLVEPTLCDRRHKAGCSFQNPPARSELPPIEVLRGRPVGPGWPMLRHDYDWIERIHDDSTKQCLERCVRRKGMSLFRANRQIYDETTEIFWKENTFCLNDRREAKALLDLDIWHNDFSKVQKLVVWETLLNWDIDRKDNENLRDLLERMTSLRSLVLPSECLWKMDDLKTVVSLPKLTDIRTWKIRPLRIDIDNWLFIGIHHDLKTIEGCGKYHNQFWLRWQCAECKRRYEELDLDSRMDWVHDSMRDGGWCMAAQIKIAEKQPIRKSSGPHTLRITARVGVTDRHQVSVWGLPSHRPGEWEAATKAEALKKTRAERRERITEATELRKQSLANKRGPFEDGDFSLTPKADRRIRQTVEKRVNHEKVLEDRTKHRKKEAKAQKAKARDEKRRARLEVQAEKEVEKKEARKRVQW